MSNDERGRLIRFRLPPPKKIVSLGTEEVEIVYTLRAALDMLDGSVHLAERLGDYAEQAAASWSRLLELGNARVVNPAEVRQAITRATSEAAVAREGADMLRAARRTLTAQVGGEDAWPVTLGFDADE